MSIASGASDIDMADDSLGEDNLEKLEAELANAKHMTAKKIAEEKAEKDAAATHDALEKAKALLTKTIKKPAAAKAGSAPVASKVGKAKAAASPGSGKAVISKGKGEAGVSKGKGKAKAASGVCPPGGFDIDHWIATYIRRSDAISEPKRRNYVSLQLKRSHAAAKLCGIDEFRDITKKARDAAGHMHDAVHKPK